MRKINKRKIAILIVLAVLVIIELLAYGLSRAQNIKEIKTSIIDYDKILADEQCLLNAIDSGESGYYILLPELLNKKFVAKYFITEKEIQKTESDKNIEPEENNAVKEGSEGAEEITVAESSTEEENAVERFAGDKIFLTQEEIDKGEVCLTVEYDKQDKNEKTLYNQVIEQKVEDETNRKVVITGYMPIGAQIKIARLENEEIYNSVENYLNEKVTLQAAYDITILYEEKEYQPTDFDENVKVTILGMDEINKEKQKYKVIHVKENETEEINHVNTNNNEISFSANEFSPYVILLESGADDLAGGMMPLSISYSESTNTWDGSVATSFAFGTGTSSDPYLISTGSELAYLASQVNSGTTYVNSYFQLTNDIDLNSNTWTPIGNYTTSFRGIFDGAGHTIANATITIATLPTSLTSHGFFGSIGGGSNYTEIKNVEFENIDVTITASGTTANNTTAKGYYIGVVTGTMFIRSSIINVITNGCDITDTATVSLRNNSVQIFVGGIAGWTVNSTASTTDPGSGNRYILENCFSSTNIDLDITLYNSTLSYAGQYHVGGMIGMIRSQPVWPSNSLYTGNVDATNGFTGPIFGALRNTTNYTSTANFATLWNGNDSGSLTMDSYYNDYSTNSYVPTTSVTSGTSTVRRSTSTSNIGHVQGVNKGIYTATLSSRLSAFNTYAGSNYTTWQFQNNTYSFLKHLTAYVVNNDPTYNIVVEDDYTSTYTYQWYMNGTLDSSIQGNSATIQKSFDYETNVQVVISDGTYRTTVSFTIPRLTLYIDFNIDSQSNSVTASLAGTAVPDYINYNDYTYQWYVEDITGLETAQLGTGTTLTNLENGKDYRLVATNNANAALTRENTFTYGNRTVIYVNYTSGLDSRDGLTPATAVQTISRAYSKLNASYNMNENIIVIMGNYNNTSYLNSATATTYAKNATFTGIYKGTNYNAILNFESASTYKYLTADTGFQYLTFRGTWSGTGASYIYGQGCSLTMGKGLYMENYQTVTTSNGYGTLAGTMDSSPSFHIFCGWYRYNFSTLPRNNAVITIKSGTYARIAGAGSYGTVSDSIITTQTTSRNFTGSASNMYNITINVDIQNSTTNFSNYDYDINLLCGGGASACQYSNVTQNISGGKLGRVLGGSIGNSGYNPSGWNYPLNTFIGSSTLNVTSGEIDEIYGGSLGRNTASNSYPCDSYFYGPIDINISGGTLNDAIYGAGAGAVTGYSASSTDPYKSYGASYTTSTNVTISGGTIDADIYAAGYGYSDYLTATAKNATDGGSLYGNSQVIISGGTVNGSVYAAGRGSNEIASRPDLAQMVGNSNVQITGTPTITGNIYGAGMGISGMNNMAKLTGNVTIGVSSNLSTDVYGGGNIAQTVGNTTININSGNHTGEIYGGGNVGLVNGNANVYIKGGTSGNIYGGGKSSDVTNSYVYLQGGQATTIYGGSNIVGTVSSSNITGTSGTAGTIYGGNNAGGTTATTNITISGSSVTGAIFGGGNQADSTTANVTLNSTGNTIPNIYAGGNAASVINTYVYCNGGSITTVYGGSNTSGTVTTSNINLAGGIIGTLYGGNNAGGTTTTANIVSSAGNVTTAIYGGGRQADTGTSYVTLNGLTSTVPTVYGGGQSADVGTTNVTLGGANATTVYGGSNTSGTINSSNVSISNGTIGTIYGGNNSGGTTTIANLTTTGGTLTTAIYGGGRQANTGTSYVTLNGLTTAVPTVYGGGQAANVGITNIYLSGANATTVYGGSNTSGTISSSNVNMSSGTIGTIYGGNNSGGTTTVANINTTAGNVTTAIYGGGRQADTGTSYVTLTGLTNTVPTVFGGGQSADVGTANVYMRGASATEVYGGSNTNGTVTISHVSITAGTIADVYGGNNSGGTTVTTDVVVDNGTIGNLYGGGDIAETTVTTVVVNNGAISNVYGGGNAATVGTNTSLTVNGGNISTNIYGGGNEGEVLGDTNVIVSGGAILGSLYAGGNGVTAIVYGNTNLTIEKNPTIGTTSSISPASGCVFGGGNAAATGVEINNNSSSTVNIVGGTIYGNIYGGANTSVVYGMSNVNIGYNAVQNAALTRANIYIRGTIFGGGEANASGSEVYDYSFISVTQGIRMKIDGTGHTQFSTQGSIFGSGNASSTSGASYIDIKNYGSIDSPQRNISIQRATIVTLDNSSIVLTGATDRTNEYSSTYFTISRVDEVKLKNNSALYLNYGANLMKKISSLVDISAVETKGAVTIDPETGNTTRNVDNRIYMLEGKNLNVATNEQVTTYGEANGMFFLGLYTNPMNPSTSTAFYNHTFENGEEITNFGTFSSNAYVLAMHKSNHDITVDGFYTNSNNEGYIKTDYIGVTPPDDLYYIWLVGEQMDVTTFELGITGSKYATLGTYELLLMGFSTPNTKFTISGFAPGLAEGISLVNKNEIEDIADTSQIADSVFGLGMRTGKNGWQTNSSTQFYTANGGSYEGDTVYNAENSTYTPTLSFYFYHSQNIATQQSLGSVRIRLQVQTPIDDLNYDISYVDINITLLIALYQDDYYEAAISPGEEFELFNTTETNITDSGVFSTYYSLFVNDFSNSDYYEDYTTYQRVLVSRDSDNLGYAFKENTRITMLDLATNEYYYYVVSQQDEINNKYSYQLSDFIKMGSTNEHYNESAESALYYNASQDLIYENFIFQVSFGESDIGSDMVDNTLLMELKESGGAVLIGVLGIQRDTCKYGVYKDQDAVIDITTTLNKELIYLGETLSLNVATNFMQNIINTKTIYDTKYFEQKMGIKISFYDAQDNQLNIDSLLGVTFTLDGINYYPRIDGTTRIKTADKVSNVLSRITINTENSSTFATGTYKIKIESFGSPDGIYYGLESSDYDEKEFTFVNRAYGLKATTDDNSKIIDKTTGNTLHGNNSLISTLHYSSVLSHPNITVSLERRDYATIYALNYNKVDLKNYVVNALEDSSHALEYVVTTNPTANRTVFLNLKQNLMTGTYRLVYKLYDNNVYIGQAYEYVIIK